MSLSVVTRSSSFCWFFLSVSASRITWNQIIGCPTLDSYSPAGFYLLQIRYFLLHTTQLSSTLCERLSHSLKFTTKRFFFLFNSNVFQVNLKKVDFSLTFDWLRAPPSQHQKRLLDGYLDQCWFFVANLFLELINLMSHNLELLFHLVSLILTLHQIFQIEITITSAGFVQTLLLF